MSYLWLVLAAVSELASDILLKVSVKTGSRPLLALSLLLYLAATAAWFWVLKDADLGRAIVAFTAVFLIAAVLAGAMLGERLTHRLCAGLVLALLSLWLVETS